MQGLPEKIDSKFRFVLLASARAEQMIQGARPKVDSRHVKVSRVAMDEILSEAVDWDYGPAPAPDSEEGAETEVAEEAAASA